MADRTEDLVKLARECGAQIAVTEFDSSLYRIYITPEGLREFAARLRAAVPGEQPEVLHRMKYHRRPADEDGFEDWDLYDPNVDCKDCIDVLIVRATQPEAPAAPVVSDERKRALKAIANTTNDSLAKNTADRALRSMSTAYGEPDDSGPEPSDAAYGAGFEHGYAEATQHMRESQEQGYIDAFYELANLMGIAPQPISPETVWREQMLPTLRMALAVDPTAELPKVRAEEALRYLLEQKDKDGYYSWEKGSPDWTGAWKRAAEALAALSTPAPVAAPVPAGWKLVPIVPTAAMLKAAREVKAGPGWLAAHEAMLNAAPEPGDSHGR